MLFLTHSHTYCWKYYENGKNNFKVFLEHTLDHHYGSLRGQLSD